MENSPEPILSVLDVVKVSSWQTEANGGRVESVVTDTTRELQTFFGSSELKLLL